MASRRLPLSNVPNAVNSPLRSTVGNAVSSHQGKRTRAQTGDLREVIHGQPPSKKQAIELVAEAGEENQDPKSPGRRAARPILRHQVDEAFPRRQSHAPPTAFDLKLAAARENKRTPSRKAGDKSRDAGAANSNNNNLDSIRQWQRHYRKQFPAFVLYFDNIPDEQRAKAVRRIQSLGAREEKFFSKAVTHVVTTRAIPPEHITISTEDDTKQDSTQPKTVQPSALVQDQHRTANLLDAHLQRRQQSLPSTVVPGAEPRRAHAAPADVLTKARELGIKIWAYEKLNRILSTILDTATNEEPVTHDSHRHAATKTYSRQNNKDVDLEQLLRNEKRMGPADRDLTVATQDMTTLRGFYLYVHDMDENTKPTLLREYAKPTHKDEGKWPQFRLSSAGRCPFIEDPAAAKEAQANEKKIPTRAVSANAALPAPIVVRRSPRKLSQPPAMAKPLHPPPMVTSKRLSSAEGMPPMFGSTQQSLRGHPRMVGGEPVASGVQPSNITSAIRSQVVSSAAISSTAAHPNRRLGDSKEVTALKRKVLLNERGPSGLSNVTAPSAFNNDIRAAINAEEPPPRAAKRKAQETLGVLQEDDEDLDEPPAKQRKSAPRQKKTTRDPKPGYCENCRDKFEDFDEHIQSRKHRKFALTSDNWAELDSLLADLRRPRKAT